MANTTNLNLVKPSGTDYALVSVINDNMDIIDSKVGAVPSNASVQGQIDTLNNQIRNLFKLVSNISISANSYTEIDYPDGYTRNNTMVIAFKIAYYYTDYSNFAVELTSSKIKIFNGTSQNWAGVSILLYKTE